MQWSAILLKQTIDTNSGWELLILNDKKVIEFLNFGLVNSYFNNPMFVKYPFREKPKQTKKITLNDK